MSQVRKFLIVSFPLEIFYSLNCSFFGKTKDTVETRDDMPDMCFLSEVHNFKQHHSL